MECSLDVILSNKDNWERTFVVKPLPHKQHTESIVNYLELECDDEVKLICRPVFYKEQAAVVFSHVRQRSVKTRRPLDGVTVTLHPIGQPSGVFVARIPDDVSECHVELFFEASSQSGGRRNCVEKVELLPFGCAAIYIKDVSDIQSILAFKQHKIREQLLSVKVLFCPLRDIMLKEHDTSALIAPSSLSDSNGGNMYAQQESRLNVVCVVEEFIQIPSNDVPKETDPNDSKTVSDLNQEQSLHQPVLDDDSSKNTWLLPESQSFGTNEVRQQGYIQITEKEPCDTELMQSIDRTPTLTQIDQKEDPNAPTGLATVPRYTETEVLTPQSIRLLAMAGFDKDHNTDNVNIQLELIEGNISISAPSEAQVTETKLAMYEVLHKVHQKTIEVSRSVSQFLLRQETQDKLRQMLKKEKIRADFSISDCCVKWTGLSNDIDSAVTLVENNLWIGLVTFLPHHRNIAIDAVQKIKEYPLTGAYVTSGESIEVLSMFEGKGSELEADIRTILDDQVQRHTYRRTFKLQGLKAQYFFDIGKESISKKIAERGGEMRIEKQDDEVEIHVTGTTEVIDMIDVTVTALCEAVIDIKTFLKTADDEHLLARIFESTQGSTFLRSLEKKYGCVINEQVITANSQDQAKQPEQTKKPDTKLDVEVGEVAKHKADALVNIVAPNAELTTGVISKTFIAIGGRQMIKTFEEKQKPPEGRFAKFLSRLASDPFEWTFVETPGTGSLRCKSVYHVGLHKTTNKTEMTTCIDKVIKQLIQQCNKKDHKSVALTPLGVGKMYNYPEDLVIQQMLDSLYDHLTGSKIQHVTIVIFDVSLSKRFKKVVAVSQWSTPTVEKQLHITMCAKNSESCIAASAKIQQQIKDELLYEDIVDSKEYGCGMTKHEIADKLAKMNVGLIKGDSYNTLKGPKKAVIEAKKLVMTIQKSAIDDTSEVVFAPKKELHCQTLNMQRITMPSYWKNANRQKVNRYTIVPLRRFESEYQAIESLVSATFNSSQVGHGRDARGLSHTGLRVTKIERIENPKLYQRYFNRREDMTDCLKAAHKRRWPKVGDLSGSSGPIQTETRDPSLTSDLRPEVNETYLFHGTKQENIRNICNEGLDSRVGNDLGMFGRGIYGAEMAMKADQYADDRTSRIQGELKMFLIRMLLGNCFVCTGQNPQKYVRGPCCVCKMDRCSHEAGRFDSIIGENGKLFREFVVYHMDQCYPEYLITYQRI